jgi:hypothetical protein
LPGIARYLCRGGIAAVFQDVLGCGNLRLLPIRDPVYQMNESRLAGLRPQQARHVLDFVTLTYRFLVAKQKTGVWRIDANKTSIREVNTIFREENVHYMVDEAGGVHFKFDDEFARNTAAAIAALQSPRYRNALAGFNGAIAALPCSQP